MFSEQREDPVVVYPNDEDRDEAGQKTQIAWPKSKQAPRQPGLRHQLLARHLDLNYKQCHRDGEDSITKRFEPYGLSFFVHMHGGSPHGA